VTVSFLEILLLKKEKIIIGGCAFYCPTVGKRDPPRLSDGSYFFFLFGPYHFFRSGTGLFLQSAQLDFFLSLFPFPKMKENSPLATRFPPQAQTLPSIGEPSTTLLVVPPFSFFFSHKVGSGIPVHGS